MSTSIQRANGTIIYFDTAESVVKSFPSKVTQHPIEDGSDISDHIISQPKKITVNGVISDASFMFQEDDSFTEVGANGRRVPIAGRSLAALNVLQEINDGREVFELETKDEVFSDMVFIQFSVPRNAQTGDARRVQFTAQQIRTVQRRFATVPQAVAEEDGDKASEESETGRQASSTATSVLLESSQSAVGFIKETDDLTEINDTIQGLIDGTIGPTIGDIL